MRIPRRHFLAVAVAGVAGCSGVTQDDSVGLPNEEDRTTLESVDKNAYTHRIDAQNSGHVETKSDTQPDSLAWSYNDSSTNVSVEPILSDGQLFYINSDRETVALDARSGELRWTKQDGNAFYPVGCDNQHLYTRSTGETFVTARDLEGGDAVWRSDVAITETAPTPYNGSVYIGGHHGTLTSLASESGEKEWSVEGGGPIRQLAADDSGIVAAVGTQGVERITHDGDGVWSQSVTDPSSVTLSNDLVVVTTTTGAVVGLGKDTGEEQWTYEVEAESVLSTPTVVDGKLYVIDRDGMVHAVTMDGEQVWTWDTDTDGQGWSGELHNYEITATDDWLYVLGFDEHVHVLDPNTDSPEPVSRWDVGPVTAPPLVVGEVAYLTGGDETVRAVTLEE